MKSEGRLLRGDPAGTEARGRADGVMERWSRRKEGGRSSSPGSSGSLLTEPQQRSVRDLTPWAPVWPLNVPPARRRADLKRLMVRERVHRCGPSREQRSCLTNVHTR